MHGAGIADRQGVVVCRRAQGTPEVQGVDAPRALGNPFAMQGQVAVPGGVVGVVHVDAADVASAALDARLPLRAVRAAAGELRSRLADDVVEGEGRLGAGEFSRHGLAFVVVGVHDRIAIVEIRDRAGALHQFEAAGVQTDVRGFAGVQHRHVDGEERAESLGARAQVDAAHGAAGLGCGQEVQLGGDRRVHDRRSRWGTLAQPASWEV